MFQENHQPDDVYDVLCEAQGVTHRADAEHGELGDLPCQVVRLLSDFSLFVVKSVVK